MENKLIKTKIENLIKETKKLTIDNAILYIKVKFPENEFIWEKIDEGNDFYYDHRDIIHLTNRTDLIISYPGGDRLGGKYSEPYTNISFHNVKFNSLDNILYLFFDNNYNEENQIANYLNELAQNDNLSNEEILIQLNNADNIPYHLLNQLSDEQLQNKIIKNSIVDCIESIAFYRRNQAYDQYQYGHYGGEDIYNWELSESSQFKNLLDNLPDKVKKNCKNELEKSWLLIPDTKKDLIDEKSLLQKEIKFLFFLSANQENVIQDIRNRYYLLKNYDTYLSNEIIRNNDDVSLQYEISTLWHGGGIFYLDCLDTDRLIKFCNTEIHEVNQYKEKLYNENKVLEQENEAIEKKHFYFWQTKNKNESKKIIAKNLFKINKNICEITECKEQIKELYKQNDIGIQFKKDVSIMVENNPMKNIESIYSNLDLDYYMYDLNNFSKEQLVELIKDKIESKLSQLEPLNNKLMDIKETLSKITLLEADKALENNDNEFENINKLDEEEYYEENVL